MKPSEMTREQLERIAEMAQEFIMRNPAPGQVVYFDASGIGSVALSHNALAAAVRAAGQPQPRWAVGPYELSGALFLNGNPHLRCEWNDEVRSIMQRIARLLNEDDARKTGP